MVLGLKCRCSMVLGSSGFRVLQFQFFWVLAFQGFRVLGF